MIGSNMKRVIALIAASAAAVSLAACGSNSSQDSKTIEFWDPYPQKNDSSTWAKYVTNCAPEGYNVKRVGYAQSDLLNNLTTAVKAGNARDSGYGAAILWTISQGYLPSEPAGQRDPLLTAIKQSYLQ